ncbi:MAG: TonB-dependent receptor [Paludibaculum sp.]
MLLNRAATLLVLLVLCVIPLLAQVTTADVLGTVTDATGAVLPDVKITVHNIATAADYNGTSDSTGNYLVRLLPPGRYSIKVAASGFKTWTVPEVTLAIGDRLRQDVRLEVGSLEQSVEVTASSPVIQADKSSVSNLITTVALQNLPLNGRNFVVLAQLTAGASEGDPNGLPSGTRPDDRRQTSAVTVNAQPTSYNNFLIDGMDDNERSIGTVILKPSVDALQEMKVETSLYSAEYGRTSGGVINFVTKSGTNEYHGSLFEFLRNEKLDARNFFAPKKPSYKQNQFGGSIGGPIRQNTLFFFGDFEGFRQAQGQTFTSSVPTANLRTGNFSGVNAVFDPLSTVTTNGVSTRTRFTGDQIPMSRMDPVSMAMINLYPAAQTSSLVNNFSYLPTKTQNNYTMDARGDWRVSNANTVFARYSFNDTYTVLPPGCPDAANGINPVCDTATPGRAGTAKQRAQSAQINDVHVFGSRLVLELKAGFSRYYIYSLPQNYGSKASDQVGLKGINIDDDSSGLSIAQIAGFTALGDWSFIPLLTLNNMYQYSGNVNYIQGSHNLKVGGDVRRRQISVFQSAYARGQFNFDSNLTNDPSGATSGSGNSVASFLLGYPASTQRQKFLVYPGWRTWETDLYVQDDWRITRHLTLNMGLRWDYFPPMTEVANRIANVDLSGKILVAGSNGVSTAANVASDHKNFSPRFGFAYSAPYKFVVRGGYGISYTPNMLASNMAMRNPPFVSLYSVTATTLQPLNRLSDGLPSPVATDPANPTGNLIGVSTYGKIPYVQQYNLTVSAKSAMGLPRPWRISGCWVATSISSTEPRASTCAPAGAGAVNPRRPYYSIWPNAGNVAICGPWYNSVYQGMQSTLERRFHNGLSVLTTYTYAHSIDNASGSAGTGALAIPDFREHANSILDLRHRYTFLGDYSLPFGRNGKRLRRSTGKGLGRERHRCAQHRHLDGHHE